MRFRYGNGISVKISDRSNVDVDKAHVRATRCCFPETKREIGTGSEMEEFLTHLNWGDPFRDCHSVRDLSKGIIPPGDAVTPAHFPTPR